MTHKSTGHIDWSMPNLKLWNTKPNFWLLNLIIFIHHFGVTTSFSIISSCHQWWILSHAVDTTRIFLNFIMTLLLFDHHLFFFNIVMSSVDTTRIFLNFCDISWWRSWWRCYYLIYFNALLSFFLTHSTIIIHHH